MYYNMTKIDYGNNEIQYRLYDSPIFVKEDEPSYWRELRAEKLEEKKQRDLIKTPFISRSGGFLYGSEIKKEKIFNYEELIARKMRSISSATSRAKKKVYMYARSNKWDYFFTLTISPNSCDRYDLKACSQKVRKWFNNIKERFALDLKYLIVPEQHKLKLGEAKRAWHFHALVSNVGSLNLEHAVNQKNGKLLFTSKKDIIYNISDYKLGFTTATVVNDSAKAANYITKYITKDLISHSKGSNRYYASNNLDKPTVTHVLISDDEKKIFIKKRMKKITFRKDVYVRVGCFSQHIIYLEVKNSLKTEYKNKVNMRC